jgi:uncharacterized membrane protein YkoI
MKAATIALAVSFAALGAAGAQQQGAYKRDIPDSLAKSAKISEADAVATARKRVPKGAIQAVELEREKGKLMYSFDMKIPGKSGIEEVNVDAISGKVLSVAHETAATEAKEAAADAKAAKKAAKKNP